MTLYKAVIPLNPITKKNSQQIIKSRGRPMLIQSKRYRQYEKDALMLIKKPKEPISAPVNLRCVFYRATKHRVDLSNLIEAAQDVLVKAGVIEDDNYKYIKSLDGCRVEFDKENPRTEIEIEEVKI